MVKSKIKGNPIQKVPSFKPTCSFQLDKARDLKQYAESTAESANNSLDVPCFVEVTSSVFLSAQHPKLHTEIFKMDH